MAKKKNDLATPTVLAEGVWWPWVRVQAGAENWPERCDSLTIT